MNTLGYKPYAFEADVKTRQFYDCFILVAGDEAQIYGALDSIPDLALARLGGHGNKKGITMDILYSAEVDDERKQLGVEDSELGNHLRNMLPDGRIFIYGCSTAEGGRNADNFANSVIKWSNGKVVYAATEPFGEPKLISVYPFAVKLTGVSGQDCTYTNDAKQPK